MNNISIIMENFERNLFPVVECLNKIFIGVGIWWKYLYLPFTYYLLHITKLSNLFLHWKCADSCLFLMNWLGMNKYTVYTSFAGRLILIKANICRNSWALTHVSWVCTSQCEEAMVRLAICLCFYSTYPRQLGLYISIWRGNDKACNMFVFL